MGKNNFTVGPRVRRLRQDRRWSQRELAERLDLSQPRLSQIERGQGTFTAEQFLTILRIFNVPASAFDHGSAPADGDAQLQNALARLGATHLRERSDLVPDEKLDDLTNLVGDALLSGRPRLITALAPVLVKNIDAIQPGALERRLAERGLAQRFGWLIENTLDAVNRVAPTTTARKQAQRHRRAEQVLGTHFRFAEGRRDALEALADDLLDRDLRSSKSVESARNERSPSSRRWKIITRIQPEDFLKALRDAHEAD